MTTIKNTVYLISFILSLGIVGSIETDRIELSLAVSMLLAIAIICVTVHLVDKSVPYVREIAKALRRRYARSHKTHGYKMQRV